MFRALDNPTVVDTMYISRTIELVLHKTGYSTKVQSITIDTSTNMFRTFVLEH
ncbi:MAG: hypothetical protein HY960_02960 [Ignavibacteriae bacterium]|nr:hypothetical protein [Ignavibacteriota bacterium]